MRFFMIRFWIATSVLLVIGCIDPPDFPDEPTIEFLGWSKSTMNQGDLNGDSVLIQLSFTDGDGDLGYPANDPTQDIFVIDTRTGVIQDRLKMPEVPEEGTGNGVNGELTLRIFNTCCFFPKNIPPCTSTNLYPTDTLRYEIYIEDRSGNESNRIMTPEMVLKCNL